VKISARCEYALRVILELAGSFPGERVHLTDLSNRRLIPLKFLDQVMLVLRKGGFVQSKKGPNGGYVLTREPSAITLGEVIRCIDGPVYPTSCGDTARASSCTGGSACVLMDVWKEVDDAISGVIDRIDFKELKEKEERKKSIQANMFWI
jgi:Rrf2 family cysteine metabolism transcriptional repressor